MNKLMLGSMLLLLFSETIFAKNLISKWTEDDKYTAKKIAHRKAIGVCTYLDKSIMFISNHCKSNYNGATYTCTEVYKCY